ncbi:hypothetical protein PGTUg99_033748 [Puccinia graminis f. sp. tritici]|uniref:RING-type domain-containing protein n=1 Tax=Puccinia graminis f. sp. tritici TaxID=56615 RepID=A0A5B0N5P1_PUCGR|nr:hypothetical protein PGTUg99_033748 [Puccinia graminis f. sp. tritici]
MKPPRLTSLFFSSAFLILLLLKISQEAAIPSRRVELVSQYDCKENGLAPAGIGKAGVSSEEKICVVCQEDLQSAKDNLKQPIGALDGCGHSFRRACADQWLVASGTCPTCRHEYKLEYKYINDPTVYKVNSHKNLFSLYGYFGQHLFHSSSLHPHEILINSARTTSRRLIEMLEHYHSDPTVNGANSHSHTSLRYFDFGQQLNHHGQSALNFFDTVVTKFRRRVQETLMHHQNDPTIDRFHENTGSSLLNRYFEYLSHSSPPNLNALISHPRLILSRMFEKLGYPQAV